MMWVHLRDFGQPQRLRSYLLKRFARIYPVYWALCLVIVPLTVFAPNLRDHQDGSVASILASILLLPHPGPRLLNVTWTLEYELLFYLAFTLFFFSKRLGAVAFGLWLAAIAGWNLLAHPSSDFSPVAFPLNLHILEFCAGMLIAWLARRGMRFRRPLIPLILGLAGFLLANFMVGIGRWSVLGDQPANITILFGGALATLILFGTVHLELTSAITVPYPLRLLGAASYSVYLTHYLAVQVVIIIARHTHLLAAIPYGVLVVPVVLFALVPGILLHLFVEKPLLVFTSARLRGRQIPNPAAEI